MTLFSIVSCENSNQESCNSASHLDSLKSLPTDTTRFPNDRSELALLMRNLYDEIKEYKNSGNLTDNSKDWKRLYAHIKTATPTESKNSGPTFEAFSDDFLLKLEAFQNEKDSTQIINIFNGMVESCVSCHQEFCPGPVTAIKKLKI